MELSRFREPEQPGHTRRVFSEPYRRSRSWIRQRMAEVGLRVQEDPAGNLLGELPGRRADLPWIALGSHSDTVLGGGRFDGMVGVLAAIEVARLSPDLAHPLLVVDFLGEEPNQFGISCLGSRAVSGQLTPAHLGLRDAGGGSLAQALEEHGARPKELSQALWSGLRLAGYLELHIEQGRRLEQAGYPLGLVTGICGIHRGRIVVSGRADHAGTASMSDRRDALAGAAQLVLLVERLARASRRGAAGVGTVGQLAVVPGAANVVPEAASLTLELRSTSAAWLASTLRQLEAGARRVTEERSLGLELEWVSTQAPVACAPQMQTVVARAASRLGLPFLELESGASHDAAHLANLCPVGMIFVPSREGRSHCPEEWTEPGQVAVGVRALLAAVRVLDLEPAGTAQQGG